MPSIAKLIIFGMVLGLLCASRGYAAGDALIVNGELEHPGTERGRPIQGWTNYVWEGTGNVSLIDVGAFQGQRAALIDGSSQGKIAIFQQLNLKTCSYRLTATVAGLDLRASDGNQSAAVYLEIAGRASVYHDVLSAGSGWRVLSLDFSAPIDGTASVYFFNYGTGSFLVDNVSLTASRDCQPKESFALGPVVAPLVYQPPLLSRDVLLSGFCDASELSQREFCSVAAKALIPAQKDKAENAVIANFADLQPFSRADSWTLSNGSARIRAGSYMEAGAEGALLQDWSGYSWLVFTVDNIGAAIAPVTVEIYDEKSTDYWSRVNWDAIVPPGRSEVRVPLRTFVGERLSVTERRRLDTKHIQRLILSAASSPADIIVSAVFVEPEKPYLNDFPKLIKLDAGAPSGPVMTGFMPLHDTTLYGPRRGYGLAPDSKIGRVEDRRHPDDLMRDWISFKHGGLEFDLPNGTYHVWMMLEDPGYWEYFPNYQKRSVWAQGKPVLNDNLSVRDFWDRYYAHEATEDHDGDNVWQVYIRDRYRPLQFDANVRDGKLSLRFDSYEDPLALPLSALVIYPLSEKARGDAFLQELWQRLEQNFNAEYRRITEPGAQSVEKGLTQGPALQISTRSLDETLDATAPRPDEVAKAIEVTVARNSTEAVALNIYAQEAAQLTAVNLELGSLPVTAFKVRNKIARATPDGTVYSVKPRILDPLYVTKDEPIAIAGGHSRTLIFDVKALEKTPAGRVKGQLKLSFSDGQLVSLPFRVVVTDWTLPDADIPIGYLGIAPQYPQSVFPQVEEKRRRELDQSLRLLRDAGMTAVSGGLGGPRYEAYRENGRVKIDFSSSDFVMRALALHFPNADLNTYGGFDFQDFDLRNPTQTDALSGLPYENVLNDILTAVKEHGGGANWRPLVYNIGDEPDDESVATAISAAKLLKQADPSVRTSIFTSFTDALKDPRADLAAVIDRIYVNNHSAEAIAAIKQRGAACALYNQRGRYRRGLYLLKLRNLGCGGHFQFAFHSVHADPFFDLDGREDDQVAVFFDRNSTALPTLDFLRYREAVNDYRYLRALELAIARAAKGEVHAQASRFLTDFLQKIRVGSSAPEAFANEEMARLRQQVVALIGQLTLLQNGDLVR